MFSKCTRIANFSLNIQFSCGACPPDPVKGRGSKRLSYFYTDGYFSITTMQSITYCTTIVKALLYSIYDLLTRV